MRWRCAKPEHNGLASAHGKSSLPTAATAMHAETSFMAPGCVAHACAKQLYPPGCARGRQRRKRTDFAGSTLAQRRSACHCHALESCRGQGRQCHGGLSSACKGGNHTKQIIARCEVLSSACAANYCSLGDQWWDRHVMLG